MSKETKQKLLVYLITTGTIIAGVVLSIISVYRFSSSYFLESLFFSIAGGLIGGGLYMGRGFYQSVAELDKQEMKFDFERWIWWYLLRPFLSAIAGGLVFLIIYVALNLQDTMQNQIIFFISALFVGYNFHDFAESKLGILSKAMLSKK
jgi:hypothetical protein